MASQLNQVLRAAIAQWQSVPAAYDMIYRKYLGVAPPVPFVPCTGGGWITLDRVDPASSLAAVLDHGTLRIGHVDAAPYVFRVSAEELAGLDYDNGRAIAASLAAAYPGFSSEPEWVLVGGTYASETDKSMALKTAMEAGAFDVALSGLANIGDEIPGVDWLCATNQCFSNLTYTGLGDLPVGRPATRGDIVTMLKRFDGLTVGYVSNNPGPSSYAMQALVDDVGQAHITPVPSGDAGPAAVNEWVADQKISFALGDGIAQSWLALTQWPLATSFNVQVATAANPPQQVSGFTRQAI